MANDVMIPDPSRIDFKMHFYDSPITVVKAWDSRAPDDDPIVEGYGSSSLVDADGDIFHDSALKSLCLASNNMTTWRNHEYEVPDCVFGRLQGPPEIDNSRITAKVRGNPEAKWQGVRIVSTVESLNEPAMRSYKFIQKGYDFGWSVGCHYTDCKRRSDGRGAIKGFDVYEVDPVEWSIVGIPSNPASWIEAARKGLVAKGKLPPREDDEEVAYVLKHWSDFDDVTAVQLRRLQEGLASHGLCIATPAEKRIW